jgi:transcriptional regulator with XRE-family HTH domain
MSVRGNLAENLRRLCLAKGSINAACRDMSINRQQFDRYLTMQSTPNPTTLKTLCRYFNIEEQELFADPPSISLKTGKKSGSRVLASCKDTLEPLFNLPAPSLKPGIYYLWLSIPNYRDRVVCAPVILRNEGEFVTFRRITGAGERDGGLWSHHTGDHKGMVIERLNWFVFSGVNQLGTHEPSLLRLRWIPMSVPVLSGYGMVMTQTGPGSLVMAVMRPAPAGATLRHVLKNSRAFAVTDPFVDPLVLSCFEEQRKELIDSL